MKLRETFMGKPTGKTTAAPAPTEVNRQATLLDRLEFERNAKETQFAVLNQELIELDAQIAGLKRAKALYPQIEQLVESLRHR